jgi:hypothetical protein
LPARLVEGCRRFRGRLDSGRGVVTRRRVPAGSQDGRSEMPKAVYCAMSALLVFAGLTCCVSVVSAQARAEVPNKEDSDSVFGLTRVWKIHLRVSAADWKAMQPAGGGFPGFGPPPGGGGFPGRPPAGGSRPNSGVERTPTDAPQEPARPSPPGTINIELQDWGLEDSTPATPPLATNGAASYSVRHEHFQHPSVVRLSVHRQRS